MSLTLAKNIFMRANINSTYIVILVSRQPIIIKKLQNQYYAAQSECS